MDGTKLSPIWRACTTMNSTPTAIRVTSGYRRRTASGAVTAAPSRSCSPNDGALPKASAPMLLTTTTVNAAPASTTSANRTSLRCCLGVGGGRRHRCQTGSAPAFSLATHVNVTGRGVAFGRRLRPVR